jgi:DNA-binding transcriptional ArsR family regulator
LNESERNRSLARARILKSLAHPTRIFIVDKLAEKPHCVCELTEMIGADTSTVSKHLSILKSAGIISDRKQGTTVYYSLEAPCLLRFIGCVQQVIEQNAEKQLASIGVVMHAAREQPRRNTQRLDR